MIQFKFYASRKGHYNNKLFCFNIKEKLEVGNILIPFIQNHNTFNQFYIFDSLTNYTYSPTLIEVRSIVRTAAALKGIRLVKT
jgi:hypothetical protein